MERALFGRFRMEQGRIRSRITTRYLFFREKFMGISRCEYIFHLSPCKNSSRCTITASKQPNLITFQRIKKFYIKFKAISVVQQQFMCVCVCVGGGWHNVIILHSTIKQLPITINITFFIIRTNT